MPNQVEFTLGQWLTVWMLTTSIIVAGVYDLFTAYSHGKDATISVVILSLAREWPILPFALGVLMGHLLWPQ